MTLRLVDRSGAEISLSVGGRRELVIGVATADDTATTLRRAVRADLLRRAAELRRAVVTVVPAGPADSIGSELLTAYNCRPFGERRLPDLTIDDQLVPGDGEPFDLDVDPLAMRLALLGHDDGATPAAATAELARWRQSTATWAESPSAPYVTDVVARCHGALERNLDVAQVLAVLREVAADPLVPPGAKFETFAHLDALLGLDLTRSVGLSR
ncbi:MAG TPA: hypothetical protein VNB94_03300 [Mycobacteriales bacterium]|nr:hypothetical protein [Mycobacteriales bacterium]